MTPRATYRVQLGPEFPFAALAARVSYLASLGISHVYLSPIFRARAGSTHGYDVVDPTVIAPALGGEPGFIRLAAAARARGLGLILDVVPNHMAVSPENPWLHDVLEAGERSPFARMFDVDWDAHAATVGRRLVLPLLAEPYAAVLANGGFAVALADDGFVVAAPCGTFPLAPETWPQLFAPGRDRLAAVLGAGARELVELDDVLASAARFCEPAAARASLGRAELDENRRSRRALAERFRRVLAARPELAVFVRERLAASNSAVPAERARLHALLELQHYRFVQWCGATGQRNFRRFADIDDLIAVRVEDEDVFRVTHELVLRLATDGLVAGLRIDHVDGLADPAEYFARLRGHLPADVAERLWIAAEHVLAPAPGEALPADWGIAATTGYDFLAAVTRLQVRAPSGASPADAAAIRREILATLLADERDRVVDRLARRAAESVGGRDLPRPALEQALVALTARLEGGRTFVRPSAVAPADARRVAAAAAIARGDADSRAVDFVATAITSGAAEDWSFVQRWQQLCAATGGKAIEDTLCYRDHRLLVFDELGLQPVAEPAELSIEAFHAFAAERLRAQPATLNATSTHDSKWSEDARARLAAVSELQDELAELVRGDPDADVARRFLQVLISIWPLENPESTSIAQRVKDYLVKAAREAKQQSSWLAPDAAYEAALVQRVDDLFTTKAGERLRERLRPLLWKTEPTGLWNSLAAIVLKVALPGIPDFYQGLESWAFHLVDPDNRRRVDFAAFEKPLAELDKAVLRAGDDAALIESLLRRWHDGRLKQWVTARVLRLRRQHPELFARGAYIPCAVEGPALAHVVVFERRHEDKRVLVAVGRHFARLPGATRDAFAGTSLIVPPIDAAHGAWTDVMTGAHHDDQGRLALPAVFAVLPVAVLASM